MNLVFGDPQVIAKLQEDKPHIIEGNRHYCNCPKCECDRDDFKCSVCGREEENEFDMFNTKTHKCRSCGTELLTVSELNTLKRIKIDSYTPVNK